MSGGSSIQNGGGGLQVHPVALGQLSSRYARHVRYGPGSGSMGSNKGSIGSGSTAAQLGLKAPLPLGTNSTFANRSDNYGMAPTAPTAYGSLGLSEVVGGLLSAPNRGPLGGSYHPGTGDSLSQMLGQEDSSGMRQADRAYTFSVPEQVPVMETLGQGSASNGGFRFGFGRHKF